MGSTPKRNWRLSVFAPPLSQGETKKGTKRGGRKEWLSQLRFCLLLIVLELDSVQVVVAVVEAFAKKKEKKQRQHFSRDAFEKRPAPKMCGVFGG